MKKSNWTIFCNAVRATHTQLNIFIYLQTKIKKIKSYENYKLFYLHLFSLFWSAFNKATLILLKMYELLLDPPKIFFFKKKDKRPMFSSIDRSKWTPVRSQADDSNEISFKYFFRTFHTGPSKTLTPIIVKGFHLKISWEFEKKVPAYRILAQKS